MKETKVKLTFTGYEKFMIAIIATLQFTIILDFMVLSPLGAMLMPKLKISTSQFGLVVSAYAFSAGISGILAAGFADNFDRKKLLLFFYCGFLFGTLMCAIAPTYNLLLAARIITGIFGGVIGSIGFAIITDIFKMEVRGRVMGFVQTAFAASQILGLPIGLHLANKFSWHAPFWMIVFFGIGLGVVILIYMKPITAHLIRNKINIEDHLISEDKSSQIIKRNPFQHLWTTISNTNYLKAFLGTVLLATGGYMLMPFGSAFSTNNLKLNINDLPLLYGITGVFSIAFGPLFGKLADKIGKYPTFIIGTIISIAMVSIYTQLGASPFALIVFLNVILFSGITARMISSSALMTAIPSPKDRGAFMSINSAIQQLSGGIAAAIAGKIVYTQTNGNLGNYDILGYVVVGSMLLALVFMGIVNKMVKKNSLMNP